MTFIFKNRTIFWDISKWNRGQTKWDGGSIKNKVGRREYKLILCIIWTSKIFNCTPTYALGYTLVLHKETLIAEKAGQCNEFCANLPLPPPNK